jgi:hypothetical protein
MNPISLFMNNKISAVQPTSLLKRTEGPHSTHLYKFYQEAENYNLSSSFHRLYHTWIKSLSLFLATRTFQELIIDSKTPLTWTVQTHCVCITIPFECQFGCQEEPKKTGKDSRLLFLCSYQHHLMEEA